MRVSINLPDEEICSLYKNGMSMTNIGKKYNVTENTISKRLKINNIIVKRFNHNLIHDYFSKIDTEEKAYFLGFLFADGNVSSSNNSITLKLHKKDKTILEVFKQLIRVNRLYSSKNNFLIKFTSKQIKANLISLGCIPNKSLKLEFPKIEKYLINHFVRGYFDGDGSIFSCKSKGKEHTNFVISIMSTKNFNTVLEQYIYKNTGLRSKIHHSKESLLKNNLITTNVLYRGNLRVLKLAEWLYKDSSIFLERKHCEYIRLKNHYDENSFKKILNQ